MAPPRRAAALSAASNMAASAATNRSVSGPASANNKSKDQNNNKDSKKSSTSAPTPSSSKPPAPLIPLSPIVVRLRQMWKFAAICQFLFTFDEAFGFSGFETELLENDLDGTETRVIPDLFRRLLYTLTLNRNIDESNWEDHLRKQYLNREPEAPLLGSLEEPQPWHGLSLEKKVESIHTTCEWQLWDAEKFRKLVKNEEDAEVWRIDPIGWDAEDKTYWLFDDNRLWIQHPPPPPPPTAKAKAPPKKSSKKAKAEARREAQKRKREAEASTAPSSLSTPVRSSRSTPKKLGDRLPRTPPTRSSPRTRLANGESASKQPRSTRSSRRTDEWEPIPADLLYDGDSDLSDPSEDEDTTMDVDISISDSVVKIEKGDADEGENEDEKAEVKDEKMEEDEAKSIQETASKEEDLKEAKEENDEEISKVEQNTDNGSTKEEDKPEWIEFEALAITRQEWDWISTRFAKSKHPDEKALHQLLKETVLPKVMADLDEADKQRAHELAMANRKRSSRIALKESEREERERDRIARQKMEEKMGAIRAEEEEKVRKEEEEVNLAKLREERLREREERAIAREREAIERVQREADEREERERLRELRKLKREQIIANGGQPPEDDSLLDAQMNENDGVQDDDSWELDCEVCGKNGMNLDDTDEIVCCEQCGKWQHTDCWNAFDRRVGRKQRDWENEDFFCSRCRPPAPGQPRPEPPRFKSFENEQNQKAEQPRQFYQTNTPIVPSQGNPQNSHSFAPSAVQGVPNHGMAQYPPAQPNQIPSHLVNHRQFEQSRIPHNQPTSMPSQYQTPFNQVPQPFDSARASVPSSNIAMPLNMSHATTANRVSNDVPSTFRQERVNAPMPPSRAPDASAQPLPANLISHQHHIQGQHQNQSQPPRPALFSQPGQSATSMQSSPQMAQVSPKPVSVPASNGLMGAPRQVPNAADRTNQNVPASNGEMSQVSGPGATSFTPLLPSPKGSPGNGSPAAPPRTSPGGYGNANGSPGYGYNGHQAGLPVRSPGSMNGQTNASNAVPRTVSGQPSGSFPLRHTPARSPLSGPHHVSTSSMPPVSIGQPVRSGSPSPNRTGQQSVQSNILTTGRPPQLEHELLHGRQPSLPPSTNTSNVAPKPSPSSNTGPGPSTGSLARPVATAPSPNRPPSSLPSLPTNVDQAKSVQKATGQPIQKPQSSMLPSINNPEGIKVQQPLSSSPAQSIQQPHLTTSSSYAVPTTPQSTAQQPAQTDMTSSRIIPSSNPPSQN